MHLLLLKHNILSLRIETKWLVRVVLLTSLMCCFVIAWPCFVIAWPRGYKTFFMLKSVDHEILNARKYKNIKKFGIFFRLR